jgi:hypothetical protein
MQTRLPLALALALVACGTTNGDAIESLRPDYAAERARLASFVATLPPSASITATSFGAFAPPLVWTDAYATRGSSNAAFLTVGQLADPDTPRVDLGPDVMLDSELEVCLQWTGPHNPMAASALGTRNGDQLAADCRAALAVPYVVVLRPVTFQAPIATSPDTYQAGLLTTDVIVLDHATGRVIATARVQGRSGETVQYEYRPGSDPTEALGRFAYSTLWTSLRAAIAAAFAPGGHNVAPG